MQPKMQLKAKPRMGTHAEKEGHYELVARLLTPVIDPGGILTFELYITGYGQIDEAKLTCYPSYAIFNKDKSSVHGNLTLDNDKLIFGGQQFSFGDEGITIVLSRAGMKAPGWDKSTLFFDLTPEGLPQELLPQLATESRLKEPPFKFILKTNDETKPGNYSLDLNLTYFNGASWVVSSKQVNFKVRHFFERHELCVTTVVALASVLAIIDLSKNMVTALFQLVKAAFGSH